MATLEEPVVRRFPLWLPIRVLQHPEVTQTPELNPKKVLLSPPTFSQPTEQPEEEPMVTLFDPPALACVALPIAILWFSVAALPE
jgi:hypothetical protein